METVRGQGEAGDMREGGWEGDREDGSWKGETDLESKGAGRGTAPVVVEGKGECLNQKKTQGRKLEQLEGVGEREGEGWGGEEDRSRVDEQEWEMVPCRIVLVGAARSARCQSP